MSFPTAVGPIGNQNVVGTIGTLQGAAVTASISGGLVNEPYSGTVGYVGTIGTILFMGDIDTVGAIATIGTLQFSGPVTFASPSSVTVGSVGAVSYQSLTSSATIKSTAGNLWAYEFNDQTTGLIGTASATLILFNYGAAAATGSIIGYMQAPGKEWVGIAFHRPRGYATLVASILGTGQAMVSYE